MISNQMQKFNYSNSLQNNIILFISFIIILLPSSYGGVIIYAQTVFINIFMFFFLIIVGISNYFSKAGILLGTLGLSILFFSTQLSKLDYIAFGSIPQYLVIFLFFSLTLKCIKINSNNILYTFYLISTILLVYAYLFLLNIESIMIIQEFFYKAIDNNLFKSMITWYHKPVTVFASHSIAAYFYFIFLFTHLKVYDSKKSFWHKIFNLLSIIGYLGLFLFLNSTTAFILLFLSLFILIIYFLKKYTKKTLLFILSIGIIGIIEIILHLSFFEELIRLVINTLSSESNGFLARYSEGSRLSSTYAYITNNILRPIGFTYNKDIISLGDNFIAEYIIKGGILFYIILLFSLYLFLKRNLLGTKNIKYFMFFFILSDLGYPLLVYYRTIPIFFLLLLVWNYSDLYKVKKEVVC